jgi:HK97 family phage major capsid protein
VDRVRELETQAEDKRAAMRGILAEASKGKRALTQDERDRAGQLTEELRGLDATLKLEHDALEWDRGGARAIDRPGAGMGAEWGDDESPALALPPVPARTKNTISAMAGGMSGSTEDRRAHFAAVVRAALGGNPFDSALIIPKAASGSDSVGSEGGFSVRPDVAAGIFSRAAESSVFFRIGTRVETMTSDTKRVIALDDDDESSDGEAGLAAAWTGENTTATAQVMKVRQVVLQAKKLLVVAATSNELGEDSDGYLIELEAALGRSIGKKFDRACISGTGAGQPLGLLSSPSTISVAKTVNGDAGLVNTFTWNHAVGMWGRLAPGSHESAWWLMHPTVLPQALTMKVEVRNVAGSENVGGFQPLGAFTAGGPTGYQLMGRPVVITSRCKSLTTTGDVILLDPSQYCIGLRRQITIDRSPHALFTSDQLAIRGKLRGDGISLWETPRTLVEGATTVGPAVILATR